jgi:hypothetical protein
VLRTAIAGARSPCPIAGQAAEQPPTALHTGTLLRLTHIAAVAPASLRPRVASRLWSGSSWRAIRLTRIIAGDTLHRVWSLALSAPRQILKGIVAYRFHAVAASPRGTTPHLRASWQDFKSSPSEQPAVPRRCQSLSVSQIVIFDAPTDCNGNVDGDLQLRRSSAARGSDPPAPWDPQSDHRSRESSSDGTTGVGAPCRSSNGSIRGGAATRRR